MTGDIYAGYEPHLQEILDDFKKRMTLENQRQKAKTGYGLFEHLHARIKDRDSMLEKCQRKGLPKTPQSALKGIKDSIGVRLICGFVDDIYRLVDVIKDYEDCQIVAEKDYIMNAKPNGYRSYHLILEVETAKKDCLGNLPGRYFMEIQLRTIAQDSWASLEHQMKYKHDIKDADRIVKELKRCADEMASVDLTMQTIRQLIVNSNEETK
ncbi:GTP pyrophosphokinase family protein [Streptococcus sp. zg-JUN1979]|uniref:GTP pyrophosphokinase n=1 Tax=Streptococcus sp. zg-JUN1979 TaxID=3391450 RepID=UPI0039A41EF0